MEEIKEKCAPIELPGGIGEVVFFQSACILGPNINRGHFVHRLLNFITYSLNDDNVAFHGFSKSMDDDLLELLSIGRIVSFDIKMQEKKLPSRVPAAME